MAQKLKEVLNPAFSNSSLSHTGKLVWDRKAQLAWGFVFLASRVIG